MIPGHYRAVFEAEVKGLETKSRLVRLFVGNMSYEDREKERVENGFEKSELSKVDRIHFKEFGDFSLNFEVVYHLNSRDYNKYMDIQQAINLGIKEAFEKEDIEMAFPTQTIFLNRET